MSTHIAIVQSLRDAAAAGESIVLALVVRVVGSSYGGVGTRMVIRVDGSTVGLVSGGCLESDLCAHAIEVHATGRARVVTYDTRADDDAVWGLGLGCNGLIDVLLQPLPPRQAAASAELLAAALSADTPSVLATVIQAGEDRPQVGAQALFIAGETKSIGDWGGAAGLSLARSHVAEALAAGRRGLVHGLGAARVAFEVVNPAVRLVICGNGPDAVPLSRFARDVGWHVTVIDHRQVTDALAARFPGARVVECPDPGALAGSIALTPRTAAVVMSHHFARDTDYVKALLTAGVAYIGVLGPRARTERMLAELATRGDPVPAGRDALFGPVGLDLGGDGPEAIALAVMAEVSAVMNGRAAGHLRDRPAALHDTAGPRPPGSRDTLSAVVPDGS
ncbi:XdhC family protein [soil metagenome]